MEYEVENVPFPGIKGAYPFKGMKKGQSFFESDVNKLNNLKVAAYTYSKEKKGKMKFSVRKQKDGTGYRCYRIK